MKTKTLCAILLPAVAIGGLSFLPHDHLTLPSPSLKEAAVVALTVAAATANHPAPTEPLVAAIPPEEMDLTAGLRKGVFKADFKGNGREKMQVAITNTGADALTVRVPAGQVLESGRNAVVVVRDELISLAAGKSADVALQTAAIRSSNRIAETPYRLAPLPAPKIEALISYIRDHADFTPGAIQTAVLAATENLPLSAVSKFVSGSGQLPSRFDNKAFRASTSDIIAALSALREVGFKDEELAMTVDPQLKIESMIDPLAHATALQYYRIAPENEWDYWKSELSSGDVTTRHYALYGIARYYPEVALDMLPKWAREARTSTIFRLSAIQALAETDRTEALPILRQLSEELGRYSELGRAATNAAQYLDRHLNKVAAN
jgi:hypothetical protein